MGHSKNRGRWRLTLPLPLRAKMTGLAIFICGFMGLITSAAQLDPITAPGELPAVPDLSPNSRAVQIAIARLPFPAAGLSRRKASARTLCSPSASVTGPCVCRPCPSPARAALFLLSGLLVFPLSCEGKTHQTI